MVEMKEMEMIAASPDDPTPPPSEPSLNPPSSTDGKGDVTNPNTAKKHHWDDAWNTWE